MSKQWLLLAVVLVHAGVSDSALGGVIFGNNGLARGYRWDAAPKTIGGNERSLVGGLRYSMEGGSYEAFRDLFQWDVVPSVADFQTAVEQAFAAWSTIDPVTGLRTDVSFVHDATTTVVGSDFFGDSAFADGAEIDLLAANAGDGGRRAVTALATLGDPVTLTTGVSNYAGSAIAGVDITINNNSGAQFRLGLFRRLLTHEIGHALGLNDVEEADDVAIFIDDNYDESTTATAVETLNNSWALLVNPQNPAASPLNLYTVAADDPGIRSPGVNLLMESVNLGISQGNPESSLVPLTNDEYSTRQFLYPSRERGLEPTGDYNGNGVVDAADYTVWRDTLGQTVFWYGYGTDGDRNGVIDLDDYRFWKDHFGQPVELGGGAASTVPEPAGMWLAFAGATAALVRRSRFRA